MKLDWRFVSREFKGKLKEIQALGPGTRMHFCLAPRGEFNGKSLADVYGLTKLERQEWKIPESEFSQEPRPWRRADKSGDPVIGGSEYQGNELGELWRRIGTAGTTTNCAEREG